MTEMLELDSIAPNAFMKMLKEKAKQQNSPLGNTFTLTGGSTLQLKHI